MVFEHPFFQNGFDAILHMEAWPL